MSKKATFFSVMGWSLLFCLSVFGQGTGGTITGTVEDGSAALVPGVTISATNVDTGVVSSTVSNEAGAYLLPALLPGTYQLRAVLPGFQTQTVNNVQLGNETRRYNFTMQVSQVNTNVEVTVDASSSLNLAGATVGEVLSTQRVTDLPLVSGDVLDLVRIMPGVRAGAFGQETFAGMSSATINTTRDGLSVTDGRYMNGIFASSTINPDLVGEIRLILTPVDAEMGRGNGQVQITTRSGTNRYTGAAVWNIRNTSLNANTWDNNNDLVTVDGVTRWQPTQPNWSNENQITISYGGPIIRSKTFFFALYDRNLHNQRSLQTGTVLTDTARQGIFRYWEGWNNGNADQARPGDGTNANVIASVNFDGTPLRPFRAQGSAGGAYTGNLRCFSVFGTIKADGSPFGSTDCPGGIAVFPSGGAPSWDTNRPVMDPTGFIRKYLDVMPTANYFGTGDGLNTAGIRWLRGNNANSGGLNTTALQTGQNLGADRTQFNIKIDHNFSSNHKASAGFTWERSGGSDFLTNWPNHLSGETQRRPKILTTNFTSTLSPNLLNEARFGIRITTTESNAAWQNSNQQVQDRAKEFFIAGSKSLYQSDPTPMPALFNPGAGGFAFSGGNSYFDTNAVYLGNFNPLYNFADTLRWTKGAHAFRFGGDIRLTRSNGYNFLPYNIPRLSGGAGNATATGIAGQTTANPTGIPGLLTGNTGAEGSARNFLYLMSGSIGSGNVGYWIDSPDDVTNGRWEDYLTRDVKYRDQRANEYAAFFQDDWKITRNLTLNLGVRYEYYAAPYLKGGFTSTAVGQGSGLFGAGRATSGSLFSNWLQPGNLFLSGYGGTTAGLNASTMLQCTAGIQQSPSLPTSSCNSSLLTTLEFVGPDSPNPAKTVSPNDRNNFGPIIGFSWQVPWFGEGKTTLRGGYQLTYGGSGRNGIDADAILGGAPGATNTANLSLASFTEYLDLTDVPKLVPITPTLAPGGSFAVYQRSGDFTAYAPDWVTPYTQNFNLSVTRTLSRVLTLDMRYVGTRGLKLSGEQNLNAVNVFNNAELFDALERVRRGEEVPLFDQMLAGLNPNSGLSSTDANGVTRTYGPVGTVVNGVLQTGSLHLRRWMDDELATGDYVAIAQSLNGNGSGLPTGTGPGTLVPIPAGVPVGGRMLRNGCDRLAVGTPIGTAPAGQVQTASGLMPIRCFPENYLVANPQFADGSGFGSPSPSYINNTGHSNYHSLQTQLVMRPVGGVSVTGTYTWSKTMSLDDEDYTDLRDRNADYTLSGSHRKHDFRMNGTFELPIGPNKLLLRNASGWAARLLERWQASFILNMNTGAPETAEGEGSLWNGNFVDVVGPFPRGGKTVWGNVAVGNGQIGGTYFGDPNRFIKVEDPVCAAGGLTDFTDAMGYNLRGNIGANGAFVYECNLEALADATTGQILLQNARPGTRGTLGANTIEGRGIWSFDGSMSKSFRITESKTAQIRFDATNILNHPTPPDPVWDINDNTMFGVIDGDKTGSRSFRGSLRITF
jgi:hypothetical protein